MGGDLMQLSENIKKTPLFDHYEKYGGKIVDFAGWALPVEFSTLKDEHNAVRNKAGIFDVSHMGEVVVSGEEAEKFLDYLLTNEIGKMQEKQISYNLMCYESGTVVDDLIVYKYTNDHFLLVINAGNIEKDVAWIMEKSKLFKVEVEHISNNIAQLAVQGPKAQEVLQKLTDFNLAEIKFFFFEEEINVAGAKCIVSRSGYTGEDGFELYMNKDFVVSLWEKIIDAGKEEGLIPCGLGARDTLRFESGLPLYGNELSDQITPLEAGLGFFVKLQKDDFIGKEALVKQKEEGLKRKIVGFEMIDKGIPRHEYEVFSNDKKIGFVTTGYMAPTVGRTVGLAMVDAEFSPIGTEILIGVRNKKLKAKVVDKKFYQKNYKK
jgi:aminomethyltransferase